MSISIIAPYDISLAAGLEFYPAAGGALVTRLAPQAGSILTRNWGLKDQNDFSVVTRGTAPVGNVTHDIANSVLKFTAGTDVISCVWNIGADLRAVYARVRVTVASLQLSGVILRASISNPEAGVAAVFNHNNGKFSIHDAGVGPVASSTVSYSLNTWYRFYLSINGDTVTFKIYDDSNSLIETVTYSPGGYGANVYGGIWAHSRDLECSWAMFGTNTEDLIKNFYLTISPAATHKFSIPGASIADIVDCLNYLENSLGGTGSLSYGYQLNGGSLVSGQTLAQLKAAVRNATITVHTDSLIVYVSHISNGNQQVESAIKMGGGLYVVDPVGGGGGISKARLINSGGF